MKKLLVLLMLMLTAFTGCNSSTGDDDKNDGNNGNTTGNGGTYTISGSVRLTSTTGAAISGVTVILASTVQTSLTPLTTTTGSNGTFSFSNIAAGTYLVTVTKTGYTFTPEFGAVTVTDKNVTVSFIGTTVNTSGNAGTHNLYPLKTNATWTFEAVTVVSGFSYTEKIIDRVTGTMVKGGKDYWAMESTTYDTDGKEDSKDTAYMRIENDIMYTYGSDFFTAKAAPAAFKSAQNPSVFKALQTTYDHLVLLKFNVSAGTAWDIMKDSGSALGNSYSVTVTGKYIGTETVGAYSNCAKYELDYKSESNTTYGKIAGRWFRTIWLAPNVGPVKEIEMFYTGETLATIELLSTVTYTLQTSVIP
jgi:hypothetical protein